MTKPYDSTDDTLDHIERVRQLLEAATCNLDERAALHDQSKLADPEKAAFDALGQRQRGIKYGTPEYFAQFDAVPGMKEAVLHHYSLNRHHPEWHAMDRDGAVVKAELTDGRAVARMTLCDLVEMVADWRAASERYNEGSIADSIDHNAGRFGLSPQLASIIRNTVEEMGW